jgi:3-oxoadipate enol-lactonase
MAILSRSGATINYEFIGDKTGQVVTLVNGHTRSSSDFRMMARILSGDGLGVLLLDNRAAGKSEADRPFTIKDMCDDVVAIWDELGIEKSSLLGISMGGFISQGIAISCPDRVRNLILVSTAPEDRYINPTGGGWISEGSELDKKMRSYFAPGFVERNPVLFNTMVTQIRQAIDSGQFSKRSDMQRNALRGSEWTAQLGQISARTLVIHGERDLVIDLEAGKLLSERIPGAKLEIIPDAGHLLLAEAPKELYRLAQAFLK